MARANAHGRWLLCIVVLMVLAFPTIAMAQSSPTCATTCIPVGGYAATDDDRTRLSAALDAVLVDLRACLARVGAENINPAALLHFNPDGSVASLKVDVSGYEDLACVRETMNRPLSLRTGSETTLRCENRCGSPPVVTTSPSSSSSSSSDSSSSRRRREESSDDHDPADDRPADDPFRRVAITLNPLSLALLRVGLNVEILPAPHHAIIVNPFGQFISVGSETTGGKASYSNFGGELGYRFYTGSRSANGFFIGPFATLLSSNVTTVLNVEGKRSEVSGDFLAYGFGADLGGQHVFKFGLVIGGGFGLMYLASSATNTITSTTVKYEGVLPRFLFTLGYAF